MIKNKSFMALTVILALFISLSTGEVLSSLFLIPDLIFFENLPPYTTDVILQVRLPRVVATAMVGLLLGAAGVISQGLFKNPLAGPSIMGTTSGAGLFVALFIFSGASLKFGTYLPLVAATGCLFVSAVTILAVKAYNLKSSASLVLLGFAINAFLGAVTTLLINLSVSSPDDSRGIILWLMGSFQAVDSNYLLPLIPLSGIIGFLGYLYSKKLDLYSLGDHISQTYGLKTLQTLNLGIIILSCLVGISVSIAGPISFIGLISPHFTRTLLGPKHRQLYIWSAINGASLLCLSDLLARQVIAPTQIQVGVITALIGTPIFISLLFYQGKKRGYAL